MQDDTHPYENDDLLPELHSLLAAFVAGEMTAPSRARLQQIVTEDESARRLYLRYIFMCGTIRQQCQAEEPPSDDSLFPLLDMEKDLLSSDSDIDAFGASKTPDPSDAPTGGLFGNFNSSFIPGIITVVSAILILSVVVVLPVYWSIHSEKLAWDIVARVAHTVNCEWKEGSVKPTTGSFLAAGQKLELELGLAELEFASGARVILEGPAEFTIAGNNSSNLALGRLAASVPEGAQGFTVETPGLEVVDLGTEFGVEVEEDGNTDVHVFKGVVETKVIETGITKTVTSTSSNTKHLPPRRTFRLEKNQAIQHHKTSNDIVTIPVDKKRFVRSLKPSKGITTNLKVTNPSFELPNIRTIHEFQEERGCTQSRPIYGWKVSDDNQVKSKVATYQISPYNSPTGNYNVGPGATEGQQVASISLGVKPSPAGEPRSSWIYQSLGTITSADIGKTLKLSVDAGLRSTHGETPRTNGTAFAEFAINTTPEQRGKTVGTPSNLQLGKDKPRQLRRLKASLSITPNLIDQELFIVLAASDQGKRQNIYQYHFDNVEVVVGEK